MSTESPLHLVVASDARYLLGAIGTLASIRLAVPVETPIEVMFLHDGLSRSEQHRLTNALAKLRNAPVVTFVPVDADFALFPDAYPGSAMAYARLVLPEKVSMDRLIYIDVDMLVLKDLSELEKCELPAKGVGAVLEKSGPTLGHDLPLGQDHDLDPDWPYVSSGLLALDMPKVREAGVFARAMEILAEYPQACRKYERSALNYALEGKALLFDPAWNLQNHRDDFDPIAAIPDLAARSMNVHFVGDDKPWLSFVPFPAEQMFRMLLDTLEPRWKEDRHAKPIRAKARQPYASVMPLLHRTRAVFKKLRGKDHLADHEAADAWKQFNIDLHRLEAHDSTATELYEAWQAQIDAGLAKRK
ncbi:MAG: glycosyltransferase [Luteolibacter sp.]